MKKATLRRHQAETNSINKEMPRYLRQISLSDGIETSSQLREDFPEEIVFLRPFAIDRLRFRSPELDSLLSNVAPFYKDVIEKSVTLDEALRQVVRSDARLLAITSDGEHLGAAAIHATDDAWKRVFDIIVRSSKMIFVVPGLRSGTEWEIEQLVERGLLSRSIFILLPWPKDLEYEFRSVLDLSSIRLMLLRYNIILPVEAPGGALIQAGDAVLFSNDGRLRTHGPAVIVDRGLFFEVDHSLLRDFVLLVRGVAPYFLNQAITTLKEDCQSPAYDDFDGLAVEVLEYLDSRGFQIASFDRLSHNLPSRPLEKSLRALVRAKPSLFRSVCMKGGGDGLAKRSP